MVVAARPHDRLGAHHGPRAASLHRLHREEQKGRTPWSDVRGRLSHCGGVRRDPQVSEIWSARGGSLSLAARATLCLLKSIPLTPAKAIFSKLNGKTLLPAPVAAGACPPSPGARP